MYINQCYCYSKVWCHIFRLVKNFVASSWDLNYWIVIGVKCCCSVVVGQLYTDKFWCVEVDDTMGTHQLSTFTVWKEQGPVVY